MEILDHDDEIENGPNSFVEPIKWWESRRWAYNLLSIAAQLVLLFIYTANANNLSLDYFIIEALIFNLLANLFFCTGWAVELLIKYYFPQFRIPEILRIILYFVGILFTFIVCLLFYGNLMFF